MEARSAEPIRVLPESKKKKGKSYETVGAEATSASLFMVIGAAFTIVGLVDLALLWTPLRFGTPAWEFATLSQTISSLPFTGLGLVLLAVGLVRHPNAHGLWTKTAAIVFAVVALSLIVLGFLYITVAPEIVRQAPNEGLEALGRAVFKNGAELLVYPLACAAIAVFLWRGVKKST